MQMISVLPIPSSISGISNVFIDDSPIDLRVGRLTRMGIWFRKVVGCSHSVHVLSRVLLPISVAPYVYGRVAS